MKNIKHNYFKLPLLALFSYATVFISIIGSVLFTFYLCYLFVQPCEYGFRCEAPPVIYLFFILSIIVLSINIIGLLAGFFAKDQRTQQQRTYVQWNIKIICLCFIYLFFGIMMGMA